MRSPLNSGRLPSTVHESSSELLAVLQQLQRSCTGRYVKAGNFALLVSKGLHLLGASSWCNGQDRMVLLGVVKSR